MVFFLSLAAFAAYSTGPDEIVVSDAGVRAGRISGFDHGVDVPPPTATPPTTAVTETEAATVQPSNSNSLEPSSVQAHVEKYFEPADVSRAIRVAWCSSHFEAARVSADGRAGLFQHSAAEWVIRSEGADVSGADPTNPDPNTAAAAWEVYDGGGWGAFTCAG